MLHHTAVTAKFAINLARMRQEARAAADYIADHYAGQAPVTIVTTRVGLRRFPRACAERFTAGILTICLEATGDELETYPAGSWIAFETFDRYGDVIKEGRSDA